MIVVSDTTPLNYLVLINQSHLLHELYGRVLLLEAVRDEMQRADHPRKSHFEGVSRRPAQVRSGLTSRSN